ncbi:hypothetical protein TNCV_4770801 [Trichonephila clavipes]|nr:hypothetical protein TNCV_4770801 [Trichonephila clavipes]
MKLYEIAAIGLYARMALTRHGLADLFQNTGRFTNRSSSDGYSRHQVHFSVMMGISYIQGSSWNYREKNSEEINQRILEAK